MRKQNEVRYIVTDIVAIDVIRINNKSEAYLQATAHGWGVVDIDENGTFFCDEDSRAILVNNQGEQRFISPYTELNRKEWFKQAECSVILQSDSCGYSFWEKEKGLVKIFVTRNENGLIESFRLVDWTENSLYEDEEEITFEDLPEVDPYTEY